MPQNVDHLIYASPELNAGIAAIEKLVGVRASEGGAHPGRGTRNALIALGPAVYLEIIGPDPEQPRPQSPRSFGIDDLQAPRLVRWAAKGSNLEALASRAAAAGLNLGHVAGGSRRRMDGVLLEWRYTDPSTVLADGIVPFFIDWGKTPHPSSSAAKGVTLVRLRAEHPAPDRVQVMLKALGLDLTVTAGLSPALVATLDTPRGRIELR